METSATNKKVSGSALAAGVSPFNDPHSVFPGSTLF